jgi:hypothetical protein
MLDKTTPTQQTESTKPSSDSQRVSNLDIESLTNIIAEQIKKDANLQADPRVENPTPKFQPPPSIHSQHTCFNLIHRRGVSNSSTTLQLFKSFLTVLCHVDSSAIILPFMASKQHYSSLCNLKQIKEIEENRMYQYVKPYYQKQQYSISGYFHISSNLTRFEIQALPEVEERLDTNKYHIHQCPSQTKEMIPIGLLCHSSLFLHHEELKSAIIHPPQWQPNSESKPPIFDIYIGDFLAAGKKTKMLFVLAE